MVVGYVLMNVAIMIMAIMTYASTSYFPWIIPECLPIGIHLREELGEWNRRIGRMEYMLTLLIALVLYFLVLFIAGQVMELNGWALENTLHLYLFTFICMIPSAYLAIAAGVKRAHDSGCSPWYALTPLIPVLFLNVITFVLFCAGCIFLFKDKGQEGVNEYGSNPNESYNQQVSLDDFPRY